MNKRIKIIIVLVLGCLFLSLPVFAQPEDSALYSTDRELALAAFDEVWQIIFDEYWDPTFGGLDWDAVRTELRPLVARAESRAEVRDLLSDMVHRLGVSHNGIFPGEPDEPPSASMENRIPGVTGIDLRVVSGQAVVTGVHAGSPAEQAGVQPGWLVLRAGETEIEPLLAQREQELKPGAGQELHLTYSVIPLLYGYVGETVHGVFLDDRDQEVSLEIGMIEPRGLRTHLGHFSGLDVWVESRSLGSEAGYIAFNRFLEPAHVMKAYNEAMGTFMSKPGIIIDIRGNEGGIPQMALGMMGWLLAGEPRCLGTMVTRNQKVVLTVQPRAERYPGKVAVLVDGLSGSASEFFADGLQALGRARIFGSLTKGEVVPGQFKKLVNGDLLLFATSNYLTARGTLLEGVGVQPDEVVLPDRQRLLAGEDPVIEAALNWIQEQS